MKIKQKELIQVKKNMLWFRDDQPAINDGGKFPKLFSET